MSSNFIELRKKCRKKATLSFFLSFSFHKKIIIVLLWIALIGTYSVNLSLYEMEIKIRMKMEIKIRRIFVPSWLLNTCYENPNDLFHIHVQRKKILVTEKRRKKLITSRSLANAFLMEFSRFFFIVFNFCDFKWKNHSIKIICVQSVINTKLINSTVHIVHLQWTKSIGKMAFNSMGASMHACPTTIS